jgi:hypothetical protein
MSMLEMPISKIAVSAPVREMVGPRVGRFLQLVGGAGSPILVGCLGGHSPHGLQLQQLSSTARMHIYLPFERPVPFSLVRSIGLYTVCVSQTIWLIVSSLTYRSTQRYLYPKLRATKQLSDTVFGSTPSFDRSSTLLTDCRGPQTYDNAT